MVSSRRKQRTPVSAAAADGGVGGGTSEKKEKAGSRGYEEFRDKRIKENKERMQKLGILDLSKKLIKAKQAKPINKVHSFKTISSFHLSESPRRSTRLKTLTPVNYSEMLPKTKREGSRSLEIQLQEGSQPEIYTEEHEKLLGDCKTEWALVVDGYGEDGKRIYDQENGETCHQCRQKTLGRHTHCSKCDLVQGQFCGDCLYMRYGENVIEVHENPDWICPVCRGICNCSLCRKVKGWAPTGSIYRKVVALGFKSVAHFLIQTRRSKTPLEDPGSESLDSEEKAAGANECSPPDNETPKADENPGGFPFPDGQLDLEDETVEEEKQVDCGESRKHVDIDDQGNGYANDEENKENMGPQQFNG